MAFLIVGLLLLGMKAFEFGPVAQWSWWVVLLPFGLAVLWWQFADSTGLTQRRAMDKMDRRKEARRERDLEKLGLTTKRSKQVDRARRAAKARPGDDRRS